LLYVKGKRKKSSITKGILLGLDLPTAK